MQMIMMVFRASLEQEIIPLVEREKMSYTRIDHAKGHGMTGSAMGSITWGSGDNMILWLAVPDDQLDGFRDRMRSFHEDVVARQPAGVPFHVFVLPCTQWM